MAMTGPRALLARFLLWRRYRRFLGSLVRADRRERRQLTAGRIAELKRQARVAARATRRHRL